VVYFLSKAGKDSILDLFLGCFKSGKMGNSKQGYWILPIANRTLDHQAGGVSPETFESASL
jgi:hypothetical protein